MQVSFRSETSKNSLKKIRMTGLGAREGEWLDWNILVLYLLQGFGGQVKILFATLFGY